MTTARTQIFTSLALIIETRKLKFKKLVQKHYPDIIDIPSGYKRLGDFMFLRSNRQLSPDLGEAILELFPWCKGVYQYLSTEGMSRNPMLVYLGGSKDTIIEHQENKVAYVLDFAKIMFSGGNSHLRKLLVNDVADHEFLVDMFAAVGNLSLQVLYYREIDAILIEQDPYTFSFLEKTVQRNNIENVQLINQDCRDVKLENTADRIFMGYHDVDLSHLRKALVIARDRVTLHLHPIAKVGYYDEWVERYSNWIRELGGNIEKVNTRMIKHFSPGLDHIEIQIIVQKAK